SPGASLELVTPAGTRVFTVKDVLRDDGPAQAYGGSLVIMYLDAAQLVFARAGRYDRIDVALSPHVPRDEAERAIAAVVGEGVPVAAPARRSQRVVASMARFRVGLQVVSVLALVVSMLMIYNTVGIAVAQRRREIGVLRALGLLKREVRRLFVAEAVLLACVGAALGVALGRGLAHIVLERLQHTVSNLYVDLNLKTAEVSPWVVAGGVMVCLLTTALSAYLPSREAAATPPALAMHRGPPSVLPTPRARVGAIGAALLYALTAVLVFVDLPGPPDLRGEVSMMVSLAAAASLVPATLEIFSRVVRRPLAVLLGVLGQMAADNLRREGSRAIVTVAALTVGLSLALGSATFVNGFERSVDAWIKEAVPADLFVTGSAPLSQGNVRLPAELEGAFRTLPYTYAMEPVTVRKTPFRDLRISILAPDLSVRLRRAKLQLRGGTLPAPDATPDERIIFVSDNLAYRTGLKAGDTMELPTPSGRKSYRVQAVYVDYTSDSGTVLLDRRWYVRDFQDDTVDSYEFYFADGRDIQPARQLLLERYGAAHDLYIVTNAQLRNQAQGIVRDTFRVTSAMSILAVIVALLGVVNTLIGAVIDRTRELGVLRALGFTRLQVVQLFVYEAVLLAACAGLLAAVSGSLLGLMFIEVVATRTTGWSIGYYPPYGYQATVLLLALVAGGVAAIAPAWRGARRPITQALLFE
ncbi:MAG TPA: FtsX-like permease family protein, partial [Myxococcota bacterium]|nr:FtsX-like permease family protein [Myxococcota bacterium]